MHDDKIDVPDEPGPDIHDNKLYCPVSSIESVSGMKEVCDLYIKDLHFYTADMIAVSNTELWRRYLPRPRYARKEISVVNPIRNPSIPDWMPDKFQYGMIINKIPEAELLFPGRARETLKDVNLTWPIEAKRLGMSVPETVRYMLGLYRREGEDQSDALTRQNQETKAAASIYDAYHNISGAYDGIIRVGRQKALLKIKNLTDDELQDFIGPRPNDVSEVNFYLRMLGQPQGLLVYQYQGRPVLTQPVRYSARRFERDIMALKIARRYASELYHKGMGFDAEGYSHIDRLDVLANVAPYSPEFKKELAIVRLQIKAGYDLQDRLQQILQKRKAIMRGGEYYPYRFKNKVMTPDTEYNNMSLNENIKAAAEYTFPERLAGSIWERLSHTRWPLSEKFLPYRTPLEAYQRDVLWGRSFKSWASPWDQWVDSYRRGFMSHTTPFAGSISGAWAGTVVGGPGLGTAIGGILGATYGTLHGIYRHVLGGVYIPGEIERGRTITKFFDQATYLKMMMMYRATGDTTFLDEAESTMTGLNPSDMSSRGWTHTFRAIPYQERKYFAAFLDETDPKERERILRYVPPDVADILKIKWNKLDGFAIDAMTNQNEMMPMPPPSWSGWAPEVNLKDVEMKTLQQEGLIAQDWGTGFYDQQRRVNESLPIPTVNMADPTESKPQVITQKSTTDIGVMLKKLLASYKIRGYVSVLPSYGNYNRITIVNN